MREKAQKEASEAYATALLGKSGFSTDQGFKTLGARASRTIITQPSQPCVWRLSLTSQTSKSRRTKSTRVITRCWLKMRRQTQRANGNEVAQETGVDACEGGRTSGHGAMGSKDNKEGEGEDGQNGGGERG